MAAYENALKERTRAKVPLQWATTQNNLGSVQLILGLRQKKQALLSAARQSVNNAYAVYEQAKITTYNDYFEERIKKIDQAMAELAKPE